MQTKQILWLLIGFLTPQLFAAQTPTIEIGGHQIAQKDVQKFLKSCTLFDHKGDRRLFRKKTNNTQDPYNFALTRGKKTLTPDLEEVSTQVFENRCVHCLSKDDLALGADILTQTGIQLKNLINKTPQNPATTKAEKLALNLAREIHETYKTQQNETPVYGEILSQKTLKNRLTKYSHAEAIDEKLSQIVFDDLCAFGLMYEEHGEVPAQRASNFNELWESFKGKKICSDCLEKFNQELVNKHKKHPYNTVLLWDITRPTPPVNPYANPGKPLLYVLNALSLSDITVDEYASEEGSCLFGTLFGVKANMPARNLELDTRWAEHYKSKNPDADPAEGLYTKDILTTQDFGIANAPIEFINKNFIPLFAGFFSTFLLVDPYDATKNTTKNLVNSLKESVFTWSGALDAAVLASNLVSPNMHSKFLPQSGRNYHGTSEWIRNIGGFALGRGFSPLIISQALGASQGSIMIANIASSMLAQNNKMGLLFGQSLGLLCRGHLLPGITSAVVPTLFSLILRKNGI